MLAHTCLFEDFSTNKVEFQSSEAIDASTKRKWFPNSGIEDEIVEVQNVTVKGNFYAQGSCVVAEMGGNDLLNFAQIERIFIKNKVDVFVVCRMFKHIKDDEHYCAHVDKAFGPYKLKNVSELPNIHPCLLHH